MYCNLEDLINAIPERFLIDLSNDDQFPESVDEEKIDESIADADSEIDGYLRGKYILPIEDVPKEIKRLSVDITIYNLFSRKPEISMPEIYGARYDNAVKRLKDIQKEVFILYIPRIAVDSEFEGSGSVRCNKSEDDRMFSETLWEKY